MKIIAIGCTHAGTAAVVNAAKLYPEADITVYERNSTVSFLSCGIALYVGGIVKRSDGLFYSSPEKLAEMGIKTHMQHDIQSVDVKTKTLQVKNMQSGEVFTDHFDKLIVTVGSWPIIPKLPGIELENIVLSKTYDQANDIIAKAKNAKRVVVVGAGYIGVELVEAFAENGKEVVLIDAVDRIMNKYLDPEFTNLAEKELSKNAIRLALGQSVRAFHGKNGTVTGVETDKEIFPADLVIVCVGFRPNTGLFTGQLDMLPNGALVTDGYMRTSNPDIVAAGDCCTVRYNPNGNDEYIPLATNAIRMGTLAAMNLFDEKLKHPGTQGTSGIKIYTLNIASTGLTEMSAKQQGIAVGTSLVEDSYRPEFMPTHEKVMLKIVFDSETRVILGAQVLSKIDLTQTMNTMSLAVQNKMTVEDLAFADFFFQPHYNKPWNYLNRVALAAPQA